MIGKATIHVKFWFQCSWIGSIVLSSNWPSLSTWIMAGLFSTNWSVRVPIQPCICWPSSTHEEHFQNVLLCSLRVAGYGGLIIQVRINSRIFHDGKQSEEQEYTALMARDNYWNRSPWKVCGIHQLMNVNSRRCVSGYCSPPPSWISLFDNVMFITEAQSCWMLPWMPSWGLLFGYAIWLIDRLGATKVMHDICENTSCFKE